MTSTKRTQGLPNAATAATQPCFVIEAMPGAVPAALLKLPDDACVKFERGFGNHLSGTMLARDLCDEIQGIISRQADGFFTVHEAAQVLADSRSDLNLRPGAFALEMEKAHAEGHLRIRREDTRLPLRAGPRRPRASLDLVHRDDLSKWLEELGAGYQIPEARPEETPTERRARLLAWHTEEEKAKPRGAVQRVYEREKRVRPTADRSNIGKEIKKAKQERDEKRRAAVVWPRGA